MKSTGLDKIVQLLLVIGGINWGLYAINTSYDLVAKLPASIATVVYYLVGLAGVYGFYKIVVTMSEKSE